jgi:hypothetical protein
MKLKFLPLIIPLMGIYSAAFAVKMEVEDISNKIVTCDSQSPHLQDKPPGTCLIVPENTLQLRLTLEPGDKTEDLDSTHIVLQDKGEYYQYNTGGNGGGWKKIGVNEFATGATPLPFSFPRLPFETTTVVRPIHLDDFAQRKGAKIIVGVRAHSKTGFDANKVKQVHEIR